MLKLMDGPRKWLAIAALTLVTVLTRLPALLYPRAIDDESVYGVVARVMLGGGLPYRDAVERKPPLLFAVYWAVFRLFGAYDWLALHLVALGWVLLTMAGLYVLARRLIAPAGSGRLAGLLAALAYALVQPWATSKNLAFNGEVLMNLPLVWAYALVLPRRPGPIAPLAAGMLLGAAFLLKQPAAIAAVPLGVYLLWAKGSGWGAALLQAAALAFGFALVLGAATAILWHDGLLGEAWYWTVSDHSVPHVFWQHGIEHSALFLLIAAPLVVPIVAWQPLRAAWRGLDAELFTVLGWLAVSVAGAAAGGRFYPHYYIQIVPPLALLASVAYARAGNLDGAARQHWVSLRFAGIWLAVAAAGSLAVQTGQLLGALAPSAAGRYVGQRAQPSDRLFVWGQQTPLYLDAGLLPASRYIATYPLTGYIFGGAVPGISTRDRIVPGAWHNLAADFSRHPPEYIIDTEAAPGDAYPIRDFPAMARFLAGNYRWVATFADGTVYRRRDAPAGPPAARVPGPSAGS